MLFDKMTKCILEPHSFLNDMSSSSAVANNSFQVIGDHFWVFTIVMAGEMA
jgi:hypothetical protein